MSWNVLLTKTARDVHPIAASDTTVADTVIAPESASVPDMFFDRRKSVADYPEFPGRLGTTPMLLQRPPVIAEFSSLTSDRPEPGVTDAALLRSPQRDLSRVVRPLG